MMDGTEILMECKGWATGGKQRKLLESGEAKRGSRVESTWCLSTNKNNP